MTFWLQTVIWIIYSPEKAFLRINQAHSVGATVVVLDILCLLFLAALWTSSNMRYQRHRSSRLMKKDAVPIIVLCSLLFPAIWLWIALLTQGLLRLFHTPSTFDILFCLLAFVAVPQFIGWLTYPLRNVHRRIYQMWQAVMAGGLLWTTWLTGMGLHIVCGVSGWRLLPTSTPLLALLWAAGVSAARELPDALQATQLWQRIAGERVIVFAPLTANSDELREIARGSDSMLEQATNLLEVEPIAFKVGVFLFADQEEHKRALEIKTNMGAGYSLGDCLTSTLMPWPQLQSIVAHEIGHVLREQRISSKPVAFLDEGLASYVDGKLSAPGTHAPLISLPHTARVLAYDDIFYSWRCSQQADFAAALYYSHAHGFVRFVIMRLGMEPFKQWMREAGEDNSEDAGERLENAARKVYGVSLTQLEAEWRQKGTE